MNTTETTRYADDEIDLIELIKVLWAKKYLIALSTILCTVLAGIYAFTAKEQWTSKAEVIAPKLADLGDYFTIRREYHRIMGGEFNTSEISNGLFSEFNLLTESLDERRKFFMQSEIYKKLTEGKDDRTKRIVLAELISENTKTIKPDPKKEPDALGRRITFFAQDPEIAQKTLEQFISYINQSAYQTELNTFLTNLKEIIADLSREKNSIEGGLHVERKVQLENLNNALNIAKEAGIIEYSKSFTSAENNTATTLAMAEAKVPLSDSKLSDSTYLFMLGEKYLKAQIDVITQKDVIYPPRYYQVTSLLSELESLLTKTQELKLNAFSYQASPDYPVRKDKPKRVIILLIGLFIGLSLSSMAVLMSNILKQDVKKQI